MKVFIPFAVLAAAAMLAAGIGPAAASAQTPCWRTVINDWYPDSKINGRYPAHCYREALSHVSDQMRIYSDLPEQLERALQSSLASQHQSGVKSSTKTIRHPASSSSGNPRASGPIQRVLGELGPDRADSIPIPLLILAAVALLLIAAGATSAVLRRVRRRDTL